MTKNHCFYSAARRSE